jgi:trehalose 6-phosphate phosphatase
MYMAKSAVKSTGYERFMQEAAAAKERVLILDYDGTIAPFSAHRRLAFPYAGIPELLHQIMTECRTRVIVASGRVAHELIPLLGMIPPPEIWGTHGAERVYADGRYEEIEVTQEALEVLLKSETRLEREGLGHLLEVKLAAVAVHWRGLKPADVHAVRSKAYKILEPLAGRSDLVLSEFDEGVEIRLSAANKGTAVQNLLSTLGEDVAVAYLGDDITDEDAFRVLNDRGLTVLVNSKPRFTAAQMSLKPPQELMEFLKAWLRACSREPARQQVHAR